MEVKVNDFIEINYVGRFKDNSVIFDLTDAKLAKENNFSEKLSFKPIVICVGNGDVVKGLDDSLVGKEVGKKYAVEVPMELGFGRKNPKLMRLVSTNIFFKQKINPVPGLQVTVNNSFGVIRSVGGGRTLVDFNHPYSGHDLVYDVEILKRIDDDVEKLKSFFELHFNAKNIDIKVEDGNVTIPMGIPNELSIGLAEHLKKIIPGIKSVEFRKPEKKAAKPEKKPQKPSSDTAQQ